MTKTNNRITPLFYMVALAVAVMAATWASNAPNLDIPVWQDAPPDTLEEVMEWPDFVHRSSLASEGNTWHEVYFDPGEMPPPPNCEDLGLEECEWDVKFYDLGEEVEIRVKLVSDQKVLGETQMVRVKTAQFPELTPLHQAGYRETWLAQVRVIRLLRGEGLGKLMWKAGDAALKITSGGGALRTFVDNNVGWGASIMKHVPERLFVWRNPPIWTYWIE